MTDAGSERKPVIGVVSNIRFIPDRDGLKFHVAPAPYIDAVAKAGGVPVVIPALGDGVDPEACFNLVDGIVLTGGISNVHPSYYGGTERPCPPYDRERDETAFALIRGALERDFPLLAICRGAQELNVAMGGTLYTRIHEIEGRFMHRSDYNAPVVEQFSPAHKALLAEGGWFQDWAGAPEIMVNSLHSQGVRRLAAGLTVEAMAEDGQIEAFRVEKRRFIVGVQWHPEWKSEQDRFSSSLFGRFMEEALRR